MSFVVIYANEKGAVIKGDSRMCDDENDIRSEDYQKVCKINDNLIMGYTGGVEFTLRVLTETTFRNYGHSGITDYVDALREKIIANIGNKAIRIKGGCFVVAGIEDGRVRVYVARCNEEIFEDGFVEGISNSKPYLFAIGTCDKSPDVFAKEIFSATDGSLEERLNNIIYKVADLSKYVNRNISTVCVGENII